LRVRPAYLADELWVLEYVIYRGYHRLIWYCKRYIDGVVVDDLVVDDLVVINYCRVAIDDIICRIDGDDYLTDLDALAMLDFYYQASGAEILWTAQRWGLSDKNISASMPNDVNPYQYPWVTSHLKTFRKFLINNVPIENFKNSKNEIFTITGDQAIYLPCLYKSNKRLFVPRCTYHYTIDEQGGAVYHTDYAKFQKAEADYIRNRGFISTGETWETVII
jgi:hypothetical protein